MTSPPYDNLRDYKGYVFDFEAIAKQLWRVTAVGGVVVWVVGDMVKDGSESGTSFEQALYFKGLGFRLHDTMIYEKNGAAYPDATRYSQVFEYMFVFAKGKPKTINLIRDRKSRWAGAKWSRKVSRRYPDGRLEQGERKKPINEYGTRFNIWKFNNGKGYTTKDDYAYEHPAMFPEALAHDHIKSWSMPGDTVLDPMTGAGTVGKMAVLLERDFIGIDLSHEYLDIARRRIQSVELPLLPGPQLRPTMLSPDREAEGIQNSLL